MHEASGNFKQLRTGGFKLLSKESSCVFVCFTTARKNNNPKHNSRRCYLSNHTTYENRENKNMQTCAKVFETFDAELYKHKQDVFEHFSAFHNRNTTINQSESIVTNPLRQRFLSYVSFSLYVTWLIKSYACVDFG